MPLLPIELRRGASCTASHGGNVADLLNEQSGHSCQTLLTCLCLLLESVPWCLPFPVYKVQPRDSMSQQNLL